MSGWQNWINFRSKEQRERDQEAYDKAVFPYGEKQKEIISSYLDELFAEELPGMKMFNYLVIKEKIKDREIDQELIKRVFKSIKNTSSRKKRDTYPYLYMSLAEYDLKISEELNYPDTDKIRENAERIKQI